MTDPRTAELAARLRALMRRPGGEKQQEVARACGVDQGLVSRVANRKVHRWTDRLARIEKYVNMRELSSGSPVVPIPPELLAVLQRYLAAGCDASLLCKQVSLLQTAQE